MQQVRRVMLVRRVRRAALLTLTLLSACAAADPSPTGPSSTGRDFGNSVFGSYLAGKVALAEGDPNEAASAFLKALAARPGDPELIQQAFFAAIMSGRSEAAQLARQLPDNQMAQLRSGR